MRAVPAYVAGILSRFERVRETETGWVAACPRVGHGGDGKDTHPSLRISIGGGGKVIIICRTGCSTAEVLRSVRLSFQDLWPPEGTLPAEPIAYEVQALEQGELVLRDRVYRHLLDQLPLTEEHASQLEKRGFDPGEIRRRGYRSIADNVVRGKVSMVLRDRFGDDLFKVPGFVPAFDGGPSLIQTVSVGLLVPVRDVHNHLVAIKVRKDHVGVNLPKYLYLSSSSEDGPPSGVPVHIPMPRISGPTDESVIRITEGELKADLATQLSNYFTLGIPGVSTWRGVLPVLKDLSAQKVLVCFDWMDVCDKNKKDVYNATVALFQALRGAGYQVGVETW